jgi:hypothetical protein
MKGDDAPFADGLCQAAEYGERRAMGRVGLDEPVALGERANTLDHLAHVEQGRVATPRGLADSGVPARVIAADGRPSRGDDLAGDG